MPLPKPSPNENQNQFIARCMEDAIMKAEYRQNEQRLAVCFSCWQQARGNN